MYESVEVPEAKWNWFHNTKGISRTKRDETNQTPS